MPVEARFHVVAVKSLPVQDYDTKEDGTPDYSKSHTILGGHVEMNATKHGTFGKATPQGQIQMVIQNPEAFREFKDAFEESITKNGRTPVYKVYFVLDEDQEREYH